MGVSKLWLREEGVTSISTEHFPYNENNLTNCSTQRNSPPIPHTPSPTTITLPYQSTEFRASLLFQEWERGTEREGGEDKTEAVRVDLRPS